MKSEIYCCGVEAEKEVDWTLCRKDEQRARKIWETNNENDLSEESRSLIVEKHYGNDAGDLGIIRYEEAQQPSNFYGSHPKLSTLKASTKRNHEKNTKYLHTVYYENSYKWPKYENPN